MATSKGSVLVVDDEPLMRSLFETMLTRAGYYVALAHDGFSGLAQLERNPPRVVISDLNMPGMSGFEFLSVVRRRFPSLRVIAMSGAYSPSTLPEGLAADGFYEKRGALFSNLTSMLESLIEVPVNLKSPGRASLPAWIANVELEVVGPSLLLSCPNCMRSFPLEYRQQAEERVQNAPCVHCNSDVQYAIAPS